MVVIVALLLLYPISFGPACWVASHLNTGRRLMPIVYRPMALAIFRGPDWLANSLSRYSELLSAPRWRWGIGSLVNGEIGKCVWDNGDDPFLFLTY